MSSATLTLKSHALVRSLLRLMTLKQNLLKLRISEKSSNNIVQELKDSISVLTKLPDGDVDLLHLCSSSYTIPLRWSGPYLHKMPWRLLSIGFYALLRLPDGRIGFSHTSDLPSTSSSHHNHTTKKPKKKKKMNVLMPRSVLHGHYIVMTFSSLRLLRSMCQTTSYGESPYIFWLLSAHLEKNTG